MNKWELIENLKNSEGFSSVPYLDTLGVLTIGYGTNIQIGITEEEAEYLLENRAEIATKDAADIVDNFDEHPEKVQLVLAEMSYQLGKTRLSGFKKMIAALNERNYDDVVVEMLDSKWAKVDTPNRAHKLANDIKQR